MLCSERKLTPFDVTVTRLLVVLYRVILNGRVTLYMLSSAEPFRDDQIGTGFESCTVGTIHMTMMQVLEMINTLTSCCCSRCSCCTGGGACCARATCRSGGGT